MKRGCKRKASVCQAIEQLSNLLWCRRELCVYVSVFFAVGHCHCCMLAIPFFYARGMRHIFGERSEHFNILHVLARIHVSRKHYGMLVRGSVDRVGLLRSPIIQRESEKLRKIPGHLLM